MHDWNVLVMEGINIKADVYGALEQGYEQLKYLLGTF